MVLRDGHRIPKNAFTWLVKPEPVADACPPRVPTCRPGRRAPTSHQSAPDPRKPRHASLCPPSRGGLHPERCGASFLGPACASPARRRLLLGGHRTSGVTGFSC